MAAEPAGLAVETVDTVNTAGPAGLTSEVAPNGTSGATSELAASAASVSQPTVLTASQRARRERIVQAAMSLLESGEYEAIQMRDVAATAGVALATVYRYFGSKEHLYAAALLDWSKSFAERADVMLEGGTDEERLRELLRRIVRAFERWPQMLRAEVTLTASQDPQARACYAEWASRNRGALEAALPTLSAQDAAAVVDITGTVVASRLREWALGRCSIEDVHDSVQRTVDMIFTFPVS